MTFESNVLFALRFMIDCNIVGGNWIEVPARKYKKSVKNLSYCQLEFDCLYPHVLSTLHLLYRLVPTMFIIFVVFPYMIKLVP